MELIRRVPNIMIEWKLDEEEQVLLGEIGKALREIDEEEERGW